MKPFREEQIREVLRVCRETRRSRKSFWSVRAQ